MVAVFCLVRKGVISALGVRPLSESGVLKACAAAGCSDVRRGRLKGVARVLSVYDR